MKAVSPEDVYQHRSLQDLSGSPAHSRAVFVLSRASRAEGGYRSTAWTIDLAQTPKPRTRQLTSSISNARSLIVDQAGERMAFLSERDPDRGQQVHVIAFDGGEARAISSARPEISSLLAWSHDGRRLLATQKVAWKEDELDDPEAPRGRSSCATSRTSSTAPASRSATGPDWSRSTPRPAR
jgi:Tol biopolymer transport system component